MDQYLSVTVELFFGLILLFLITKALGKAQFSQITPFDFISALILGELVGNAVYDNEIKLRVIIFATILWGILIYLIQKLTQKFKSTRKLLEGEPNIVIHKGKIKFDALKKSKMDISQLQSLLRQQGYFSVQEVEYAILETNGMASVLPKSKYDIPKFTDLNVPLNEVNLPVTVILDGKIEYDNIQEYNIDERWLGDQLKQQNVKNISDVFFAEWQKNQPLYIIKYEHNPKNV